MQNHVWSSVLTLFLINRVFIFLFTFVHLSKLSDVLSYSSLSQASWVEDNSLLMHSDMCVSPCRGAISWIVCSGPSLIARTKAPEINIIQVRRAHAQKTVRMRTDLTGYQSYAYGMSRNVRKRTFVPVHPVNIQISLRKRTVWSESSLCAFWIAKDANFLQVRTSRSLIRLRACAGWFESSLSARHKVRSLTLRFVYFLGFHEYRLVWIFALIIYAIGIFGGP